jgi:hypothetical protein
MWVAGVGDSVVDRVYFFTEVLEGRIGSGECEGVRVGRMREKGSGDFVEGGMKPEELTSGCDASEGTRDCKKGRDREKGRVVVRRRRKQEMFGGWGRFVVERREGRGGRRRGGRGDAGERAIRLR